MQDLTIQCPECRELLTLDPLKMLGRSVWREKDKALLAHHEEKHS